MLNNREKSDIGQEKSSYRQNELLLSVLCYKSEEDFNKFLTALDKTDQGHVRNTITGRTGQCVTDYKLPWLGRGRPRSYIQMQEIEICAIPKKHKENIYSKILPLRVQFSHKYNNYQQDTKYTIQDEIIPQNDDAKETLYEGG